MMPKNGLGHSMFIAISFSGSQENKNGFPETILGILITKGNIYTFSRLDLSERAFDMALMVFGVVLQHPPNREAPASLHFPKYDTKSSSFTPLDSCQIQNVTFENSENFF